MCVCWHYGDRRLACISASVVCGVIFLCWLDQFASHKTYKVCRKLITLQILHKILTGWFNTHYLMSIYNTPPINMHMHTIYTVSYLCLLVDKVCVSLPHDSLCGEKTIHSHCSNFLQVETICSQIPNLEHSLQVCWVVWNSKNDIQTIV